MTRPGWIAADWGTSHLRVWAMDGASVLAEATSAAGMATLSRDGFEAALLDLIGPWLDSTQVTPDRAVDRIPVIVCGMAGSRQGWAEAPYIAVPSQPLGAATASPATADPRLSVRIVAGLKQDSPADVMRGEETQIAGYLALNPGFDGVLCLPGTHSKWAQVSAGEVVSFRTFMTGELFAALQSQTVLRHSVGQSGWDGDVFDAALAETLSRPEQLAARLFSLRAEHLLHDLAPEAARARLSGLLIGAELAAARPYWLGQAVAVIGAGSVAGPYVAALRAQGLAPVQADGAAMTRAGLLAARDLMEETPT